MSLIQSKVKPLIWQKDKLQILDQRLLPYEQKYIEITNNKEVIEAIKNMVLRGAPLIGITAAYGMALAANEFVEVFCEAPKFLNKLKSIGEEIRQSRPTAINLKWAVDLILSDINQINDTDKIIDTVTKRAIWIHEDDAMRCQRIGEHGAKIIETLRATSLLTICNTGALATGGIGTAFGVVLTAHKKNKNIKVFAAETRPRQQGARLTTFECVENGIDCTLISDTACGHLMQKGEIDLVIAGADRIAANGDTANKTGTYQLAVLAKENNIPFYIAAPLSTFDLKCQSGKDIPIEERDSEEVTHINEKPICVKGIKVKNPAFDITPAKYISGIITEKGILSGDLSETIYRAFNETAVV